MKEKIKRMIFTVVLVVITIILSTILSVYATTTILGSEVSYDNTKHPALNADNVQAAIDNTYSSALSLDTRTTSLETKVGSATLTTTNKDLSTAVNELNNKAIGIYRGILSSGSVLDITNTGYYYVNGASGLPSGYTLGYLIVFVHPNSNAYRKLIFYDAFGSNTFIKTCNNSSWGSWYKQTSYAS